MLDLNSFTANGSGMIPRLINLGILTELFSISRSIRTFILYALGINHEILYVIFVVDWHLEDSWFLS